MHGPLTFTLCAEAKGEHTKTLGTQSKDRGSVNAQPNHGGAKATKGFTREHQRQQEKEIHRGYSLKKIYFSMQYHE